MKAIIIIGGGGHAKVLASTLTQLPRTIIGFTDPDDSLGDLLGFPRLGPDSAVQTYPPAGVALINGVGSIRIDETRARIFTHFKDLGYSFDQVIHPAACVSPDAQLGEGVQIMAGAVVQAGARIGNNSIINTRAAVDHDSNIGNHVHIAPGATLCGDVRIGDHTHIGAGSCILQGLTIGSSTMVGAASLVRSNLPDGVVAYGAPAQIRTP